LNPGLIIIPLVPSLISIVLPNRRDTEAGSKALNFVVVKIGSLNLNPEPSHIPERLLAKTLADKIYQTIKENGFRRTLLNLDKGKEIGALLLKKDDWKIKTFMRLFGRTVSELKDDCLSRLLLHQSQLHAKHVESSS